MDKYLELEQERISLLKQIETAKERIREIRIEQRTIRNTSKVKPPVEKSTIDNEKEKKIEDIIKVLLKDNIKNSIIKVCRS